MGWNEPQNRMILLLLILHVQSLIVFKCCTLIIAKGGVRLCMDESSVKRIVMFYLYIHGTSTDKGSISAI